MGRDDNKLIRQLSLVSFLRSQERPFTSREIQQSVEGYAEMSDDTFARRLHGDRAGLADIGIEIRDDIDPALADGRLYFLPAEDFQLPEVDFTPSELRALSLALAALEGRFAYAQPLRLALMALSHGRPDPVRGDFVQLPVVLASDEDASLAGRQLARLEDAVGRRKTVRFQYPSAAGVLEERTMDPYSLFFIQGHWYVVGRDHRREAIRTFRVGRIRGSVYFSSDKANDFTIPADYSAEEYGARPPWLLGALKGTATVKVTEDHAWRLTRLAPHVRPLGEDDDGCAHFAVPYADESVLLSWVVDLGGHAELLGPASLRTRLCDCLETVRAAHEETLPGQGSDTRGDGGRGAAASGRPPPAPRRRDTQKKTPPIAAEHLARAISLLNYLVDERLPPLVEWETLKADLGLTRSEVEADLSLINLVNFGGGTYVLTADAHDEGVQVIREAMADTFDRPARLSPLMARALLLALDLLGEAIPLEGSGSLAAVRTKVAALVGESGAEGAIIVDELSPPETAVVETLSRAVQDHKVVVIEHFSASRLEMKEREVEPYLLFRSRDGWYLEGYCLEASHQRTFKLERVRSARTTETVFVPRPEVDLGSRRQGEPFSPDGRALWATVRFAPHWRTYLEDRGTCCEEGPDDSLTARIPYLDETWMAREVIRYLGDAVLERPVSARRRVADMAAALLLRCSGGAE